MSNSVVYRMYDADGVLLYVGMSCNLPSRLAAHKSNQEWWPDVVRVSVEHFDGRRAASRAEMNAIDGEGPKHNISPGAPVADDTLEERRAARAERKAQWYREHRCWTPEEGEVIRCGNCGRTPKAFPKGRPLPQILCERCGVAAFERQAA